MRRFLVLSCWPLVVSVPSLTAQPGPSSAVNGGYCKVCHSEEAVRHRASAHDREGITCTTCHGGNAAATDVDAAHTPDFRGAPERSRIPEFCASCHADPEYMRPYGLAADQLALYQLSGHGRRAAAGDDRAAVCTDCHGNHRILSGSDPQSPTHSRNIVATCGRCHAVGGLAADAGPTAVEDYGASVHAAAAAQGNPRAPECVRCHGSHGAAPPGAGTVDHVCGRCHTSTREAFRRGPHLDGMRASGDSACSACHGNHRILAAGSEMWVSACLGCHDAGSEEARRGEKIQTLIARAGDELATARQATVRAREVPLDVSEYEARLDLAATHLQETRPRSHSLDLGAVAEEARKARSIAQEVQSEILEHLHILDGRRFVVLFFWLYILITVAAIQLYRRSAR